MRTCTLSGLTASTALLFGCQTATTIAERDAAREISLAAFSMDAAPQREPIMAEQMPPDLLNGAANAGAGAADAAADDAIAGSGEATSGDPSETAAPAPRAVARPLRPGETRIVDSLIGQINGRPIFAEEFFTPIEDQLIRLGQERNRQQFENVVRERLMFVISNELILSEAEVGLTEQEQMGIFAFLQNVQEDIIARGGGVSSEVDRELREATGMGLEETREAGREQVLIRKLLDEKVSPRVIITWRDIEREYRNHFSEFNPPSKVHLSRITLSTSDTERVAEVQRRIDAQDDFAAIANDLGVPNGGQWDSFDIGPGGIADIQLNSEEARQALVGLEKGDVTAPFILGARTWWLQVTDLDQPKGRSLYDMDVQRAIESRLRNRRRVEEQNRYVNELFRRGVFDDHIEMSNRLITIAYARYMPGS